MDLASLVALVILAVVGVVAWTRPDGHTTAAEPHRVVVEYLDARGRVTRRVVV